LMISWIASTIFGVHYPLRNIKICQTVLRRRLPLNNVTDSEAFPGLIRQTHRKIRAASADGAYDTRLCHDELRRKKISALIPPRKGAGYWPGEYADRNRAVANQRLSGSNARWKWTTEYN
ncbi:transposase, partial [Klebsiella pneumoniae]|uniref:transposase n=1 Tax=Klebsiella pneumoniae TaxID=573 RepID=UPI002731EDF6